MSVIFTVSSACLKEASDNEWWLWMHTTVCRCSQSSPRNILKLTKTASVNHFCWVFLTGMNGEASWEIVSELSATSGAANKQKFHDATGQAWWSNAHTPLIVNLSQTRSSHSTLFCPFISVSSLICPNNHKYATNTIKINNLPLTLNLRLDCFYIQHTDKWLFYILMLLTACREDVTRCDELILNPQRYEQAAIMGGKTFWLS